MSIGCAFFPANVSFWKPFGRRLPRTSENGPPRFSNIAAEESTSVTVHAVPFRLASAVTVAFSFGEVSYV